MESIKQTKGNTPKLCFCKSREKTPTIYALNSLFNLVKQGYKGEILTKEYAKEIGKERVWKSEATYEGNTNFGLNYLRELDLIDENLKVSMFRPKPVFAKESKKFIIKKADSLIQLNSEDGRKGRESSGEEAPTAGRRASS